MNIHDNRLLFSLFCILLLCSSVQATTLLITVQDSIDNTTLPHATVFVNGGNYARTNNVGQVLYTHNGLNDQLIKVSMAGYDDWQKSISKNETALMVNLSRKTLALKVHLFDSDTLEPVYGARVNVSAENATQGKVTDTFGIATFAVRAATLYSVNIESDNYQPRTGTVDMGVDDQEVQYWLLSGNRFSVVVKDKETRLPVPDAEVRIDSVLAGKTDARGIIITPVTRGKTYRFEITKPGYQTVSESRAVSETDAIYNAEISKASIGAFIYVFDEKSTPLTGADVYFNGTLSGTTNQYGRSNFPNLVVGSYLVEVRKTGYVPVSHVIVVSTQPEDYTFKMPFENAVLSVFVQDKDQKIIPNASIQVNGDVVGVTDERGQLATTVKFNTPLNITASKEGYSSASAQKEVSQGNSTASVNLTLDKNLDWGLITMIVIGVVGVLVLFAVIRMFGHKRRRHVTRRNEI